MEGMERRFFQRLSSVKLEYEKDKRRTLTTFRTSLLRQSLNFFKEKEEVCTKLRDTLLMGHPANELYLEILCLLFPTAESRLHSDSKSLLLFLQTAFNLDPQQHAVLMDRVKGAKIVARVLQLEVVEARKLPAKDPNGLSDPFCTIYVTKKELSQRTRVAEKTLNPVWNEQFKFRIADPQNDVLTIVVWDHDPEERIRDKFKQIGEVKSGGSLITLMRELSHGRSSTREYIGKLEIPLRGESSGTTEKWLPLIEKEGEVYVRMTLGVEKDRNVSVGDYRAALQFLVVHELASSQPLVPFHWEYKFHQWAVYLLQQFGNGWGLKPKDILLAKWLALVKVHVVFPIRGYIIANLTQELFTKSPESDYNAQQVSLMWKMAEEFLKFAETFVKNIHEFFPCIVTTSQLYHILKTLETLGQSDKGQGDSEIQTLFSPDLIRSKIQNAVAVGALISFNSIMEGLGETSSDRPVPVDIQLTQILNLGQLLNMDLEKGLEMLQKDFQLVLGVDYHKITYEVYDIQFGKVVKPLMATFCDYLREANESAASLFKGDKETGGSIEKEAERPELTLALNFFKIYHSLKQFSTYSGGEEGGWVISGSFHKWFYPGMTHLLDILTFNWTSLMKRAVEIDYRLEGNNFDLIDYKQNCQITSSAFDSAQILCEIQGFWVDLSWPDPEQSLQIVDKILKKLCGFSISYANVVRENLEAFEVLKEGGMDTEYRISLNLCRGINNIDYMGTWTRDIGGQLNIGEIVKEFPEGGMTLESLLQTELEIQRSGQNEVVEAILRSMATKMGRKMHEMFRGLVSEDGGWAQNMKREVDVCMEYYMDHLRVLEDKLVMDYYAEAVDAIWDQTLVIFTRLLNEGLKKEMSWKVFANIREVVGIVKGCLEEKILRYVPKKQLNPNRKLRDLYGRLEICGVSTAALKLQYYERRLTRLKDPKSEYRRVTIRTYYQSTTEVLFLEVLNAFNLPSSDPNGLSDPYVEIVLVPTETFLETGMRCTKIIKESLNPLFEETFSIGLKRELFESKGYISFSVFDYDFLQRDDFLGEGFFRLEDVKGSEVERKTQDFPQRPILLTKPLEEDIEFLQSLLQNRSWDKDLQAFLKREKDKI